MSEALASSSATLRPGQQRAQARPRPAARPIQLGTRYLGLVATWSVAIGLTFKSELLTPNQVWQLSAGLALLVTAGLLFLHVRNRTPGWLSPDHYITPVLSVIAAAAFSILAPDYRIHSLAMLTMGAFIFASSFVDISRGMGREKPLHRFLRDATTFCVLLALFFLILQSNDLPNVIKFSSIFVVALLSGYRSFRFATKREGLALLSAFLTAGTVTFGAFGMVTYLNQGSQYVAVILAFAWYAWQGLTVHALDDSLSRRIIFEYGLFAVICVYLIALALVTGRPI
ncbi:MAG TPA: hypothetical protein VHW91_01030 [Candidatus Dormibacteraeota bacterium]|nr:hypothetical protein [Candidatus Dormibacteraeota bacterium]